MHLGWHDDLRRRVRSTTPTAAIDIDRIRALRRLAAAPDPALPPATGQVPLDSHPVWVDDDRFNLRYHVRHTACRAPATMRQLKPLTARIMSQQLDRGKPLWEIWVIEGLEHDRFALLLKTHHAWSTASPASTSSRCW